MKRNIKVGGWREGIDVGELISAERQDEETMLSLPLALSLILYTSICLYIYV